MRDATAQTLLDRFRSSGRLPSPPGAALRLVELCRRNDVEIREIIDVLMADPALSARLLRCANSAALGTGRQISSIRDAVMLVGLRTVKLTALGFSLAGGSELVCPAFDLKRFWTESVATAALARRCAAQFSTDADEAFTAGLLSGIGQLALACGLGEDYPPVAVHGDRRALCQHERTILDIDHVQFGAELLAEWELPARLVDAVRHQFNPAEAGEESHGLAKAVQAAMALTPLFVHDGDPPAGVRAAARALVEGELGLTPAAWQQVVNDALVEFRQFSAMLELELDPLTVCDLYAEAQEETARVGVVAQLRTSRPTGAEALRSAATDALTGAANRARFDERLSELLAGLTRGHGEFALLLFDVDNLERLQETYGNAAAAQVLRAVAQAVRGTLRDVDLLARFGRSVFAILAPHTDQRGACVIAARTCKRIENLPVEVSGGVLYVSVSVGLALTNDFAEPPNLVQILGEADRQLELSKKAGRSTWSYRGRTASQVTSSLRVSQPHAPVT
ncbi:MAG: HDOD domain-containing protein [Planctomycetota bacterium]